MKQISFPMYRTLAVLSLSLACTMPAMAQSTTGIGTGSGTNTGTTAAQTTPDTRQEKDRDYGWIGLLGLAGLLGLRRKHDDHTVTRNSTNTTR